MKRFCAITLILSMIFQQACFAQADTGTLPLEQEQLLRAAADFSIYEKLSLLELNIIGKSHPGRKVEERLRNLERTVFGDKYISQTTDLVSRIVALLQSVKPPDSLVQHLAEESLKVPDWSYRSATPPWLSTAFQTVTVLEIESKGKIRPSASLITRINSLRKNILNKDDHTDPQEIFERIEELYTAVQPSPASVSKAQQQLSCYGYFRPTSEFPLLRTIGNGIKNSSQKATDSTKSVLQSPTFWYALIGAGALTGAYFLGRSTSGNSNNLFIQENRCTGTSPCTHCKNCKYCKWCNQGGNPCGVYLKLYGP